MAFVSTVPFVKTRPIGVHFVIPYKCSFKRNKCSTKGIHEQLSVMSGSKSIFTIWLPFILGKQMRFYN